MLAQPVGEHYRGLDRSKWAKFGLFETTKTPFFSVFEAFPKIWSNLFIQKLNIFTYPKICLCVK